METARATQVSPLQPRTGDAPAPELHYAPRPARSRRIIDGTVKVSIIVVACVLSASLLPRTWRHVQVLRLTSTCLDHQSGSGTVACEFRINDRSPLADDPRYVIFGARNVSLVPPHWRELHWRLTGTSLQSNGTAFLGRRQSQGSTAERLVAVDVVHLGFRPEKLKLVWRLFDTGSVRHGPTAVNVGVVELPAVDPYRNPYPTRVYAGLPDPADDSHFTIELAIEGKGTDRRYVIDGWVRASDVLLVPRGPRNAETIPYPTGSIVAGVTSDIGPTGDSPVGVPSRAMNAADSDEKSIIPPTTANGPK